MHVYKERLNKTMKVKWVWEFSTEMLDFFQWNESRQENKNIGNLIFLNGQNDFFGLNCNKRRTVIN